MRNVGAISSILFIAAFIVGLQRGALGVAIGYVLAGAVEVVILVALVTRSGPVNIITVVDSTWRCVVAALATFGILVFAKRVLPPGLLTLFGLGAGSYTIFLGLMALSSSGRATLQDGFKQVVMKLPGRH